MWRQVFVICLLITLSDIWVGVSATNEYLFDLDKEIDKISQGRSHFETRGNGNDLQVDAPPDQFNENDNVQPDEIAKDVNEPEEPAEPPSSDTQNSAAGKNTKINETGKTSPEAGHQPQTQPLAAGHHKTPTVDGGLFSSSTNLVFIVTVAACSVAGLVGIIMAGVCWYKLNRSAKAASDVEYPAYGVTGPNKERIPSPGDRKLAQSAQMYHYQHQKQQMIAMEKANGEMKHDASDEESEEENEEGDYTVYECPGLAPTGEMEVKNPLFSDETPVTPSAGDDKKDVN